MVRFALERLKRRPGFDERDALFISNNRLSDDSNSINSTDGIHNFSFDWKAGVHTGKHRTFRSAFASGLPRLNPLPLKKL
jgi:hypothetical protein